MDWENKVIWTQGMFLRAQHFQQTDRYVERLVRARVDAVRGHAWGVVDIQLNRELLAIGKFALSQCRGVFDDGTPFDIPGDTEHPVPLDLPENTRDCILYLTLPVHQPGGVEVSLEPDERALRYTSTESNVSDSVSANEPEAQVRVGKLRLRYALETDERAGYVCLGIARVVEVRADKSVIIDDQYIAPCLNCTAQQPLFGFLTELRGLLHHRGEELARRVAAPGAQGVANVADFLLLQMANRWEPVLAHYHADATSLHPESMYSACIAVAGEVATFTAPSKRPAAFPVYRHEDLKATFAPVVAALRQALIAVIERNAEAIPLEERGFGIRVATIADQSLVAKAAFVLSVKADMPSEELRRDFPKQAKVGPVNQIRDLIMAQLPGITLNPLPVVPHQLPFHADMVYFALDRAGPLWKQLQAGAGAAGLAIFVAKEFPGLAMELWAIRR